MGSLMAGWDAPVTSPDEVSLERNHSVTKEEIESYWRFHKKSEEHSIGNFQVGEIERRNQKTTHSPWVDTIMTFPEIHSPVDLEKVKKTDDWWTRSNWAFLNESPERAYDRSSYKYAPQFHVAELASSKKRKATH